MANFLNTLGMNTLGIVDCYLHGVFRYLMAGSDLYVRLELSFT